MPGTTRFEEDHQQTSKGSVPSPVVNPNEARPPSPPSTTHRTIGVKVPIDIHAQLLEVAKLRKLTLQQAALHAIQEFVKSEHRASGD